MSKCSRVSCQKELADRLMRIRNGTGASNDYCMSCGRKIMACNPSFSRDIIYLTLKPEDRVMTQLFKASVLAVELQATLATKGVELSIPPAAIHAIMKRPGQSPSSLNEYPFPTKEQMILICQLARDKKRHSWSYDAMTFRAEVLQQVDHYMIEEAASGGTPSVQRFAVYLVDNLK